MRKMFIGRVNKRGKRLIYIEPKKIRLTEKDNSSISGLAESIRHNGILSPLTVRKTQYGYELVCGIRRYRAAVQLGIRKLPCLVVNADEKSARLMSISENIHKKDIDVFETAERVDEVMREYNSSYHETAALLGISQQDLMKLLGMLRFNEEERQEIKEKQFTRLILSKKEAPPQKEFTPTKIISQDVRIFINSLTRIANLMRNAGYAVKCVTSEAGDNIEFSITTSKTPENSEKEICFSK